MDRYATPADGRDMLATGLKKRRQQEQTRRSRSGSLLRRLRRNRGITQEGLAHAVGVSRAAVAQWETGRASFENKITALAQALDVEQNDLVVRDRDTPAKGEAEWLRAFRVLDRDDQGMILQVLSIFVHSADRCTVPPGDRERRSAQTSR